MADEEWLAEQFETHRSRLRAVAYRMLGSLGDAEDAVQETWLRLGRADAAAVENLGGWLTTVVARVCLDMLRARRSRHEEPLDEEGSEPVAVAAPLDPEREALLADAIGPALLMVLDRLAPAERLAFVLHDMFAVPFDEIAPIVGRSAEAARQLASRARRRVQGVESAAEADRTRRRAVVEAFLAAAREGSFEALLAVLDPEVVVRADAAAVSLGAAPEIRGPAAVFGFFEGRRARGAQQALVDGALGAVWAPGGKPRVALRFTITDGKVLAIDLVGDPEELRRLDLVMLEPPLNAPDRERP